MSWRPKLGRNCMMSDCRLEVRRLDVHCQLDGLRLVSFSLETVHLIWLQEISRDFEMSPLLSNVQQPRHAQNRAPG